MKAAHRLSVFRLGGHEVRAALVDIDAVRQSASSAIDVRPDWLHHAEWEEAEVLTDRCRRWQWLAGRLAARQVLVAARGGCCRELWVLSRDPNGSPAPPRAFTGGSASAGWLSIAHDGGLAVAVCAPLPVGVDIVAPDRLPPDAAHRWALDEARCKLRAALAAAEGGDRSVPSEAAGGGLAELVIAVQGHLVAVCTLSEAA